jgi:prophage antirepressor-like protein
MTTQLQIVGTTSILDKSVSVYGTFEEPLFLAKEVAEWIGLSNVTDMISRVEPEEVAKFNLGGLQGECNFLTEDGLYEVLMQSRKPIAKAFKSQVKSYLKELRTKGMTATPSKLEEILLDPDLLIGLATELKAERERRQVAESRAEVFNQVAQKQAEQLREAAPKIEYHDSVMNSGSLISTTEIANELGFTSAKALNQFLKAEGVLRKVNDTWALRADFSGKGYAKYKPHPYVDHNGKDQTSHHLYWTEEGRKFLQKYSKRTIKN